jgi:hypothetical protein
VLQGTARAPLVEAILVQRAVQGEPGDQHETHALEGLVAVQRVAVETQPQQQGVAAENPERGDDQVEES